MITRIFVALPAFNSVVAAACTASLYALGQELAIRGMAGKFCTLTFPDVAELRNILTSIWFDLVGTSHMLFVDADMEFGPSLIVDMVEFDKPLVGAFYVRKRTPFSFVGDVYPGAKPENGFIRAGCVGGGVMLIRRDCIEALLAASPELSDTNLERHAARGMLGDNGCKRIIRVFDKMETETGILSEDIAFCRRYELIGGEIWANISYPIGHVGPNCWRASYQQFLDQQASSP